MKKRFLGFLLGTMLVSMCAGCGTKNATTEQSETAIVTIIEEATTEQTTEPTAIPEATEEPHTHNYTEEIITDAACEADGTETATCVCGLTDTRTKEGSKLEYTYTEMNATMYATQTVNVRNLPNTDGEKIGCLSTNQEITVLGQCNETSWYQFELDGQTAFVSNSYLSTEKVDVQQSTGGNSGGSGNSLTNHFGITLPATMTYDNGRTDVTWGIIWNSPTSFDPNSNFVSNDIWNGMQVTVSDLSGSKNDCMAYITMPDGTSGWIQFSYNGYTRFK